VVVEGVRVFMVLVVAVQAGFCTILINLYCPANNTSLQLALEELLALVAAIRS
jgi:hypothetical protein